MDLAFAFVIFFVVVVWLPVVVPVSVSCVTAFLSACRILPSTALEGETVFGAILCSQVVDLIFLQACIAERNIRAFAHADESS